MTNKPTVAEFFAQYAEFSAYFYLDDNLALRNKVKRSNKATCNALAKGTVDGKGYITVGMNNKIYKYHRVVWCLYHQTDIPEKMQIDHIDGDRKNNHPENLQLITNQANTQKQGKNSKNTSGFRGVYWCSARKSWEARICVNGKKHFIGYFPSCEEAFTARILAENKFDALHGSSFKQSPLRNDIIAVLDDAGNVIAGEL